jgi:hypothetical protein
MSYHPPGVKAATDPVYHYTDGGALIGIAQNGVLWASEAAGLNDRAEVRQGWEKIQTWLNRQPPSDIIDLFKHHAANPHRASHEVFVVCGSTRGDDANQWRLYANKGAGYVIELDPQQPLTVMADKAHAPKKDAASGRVSFSRIGDHVEVSPWLHVIYDDNEIDDALTQLVADTKATANSIADSDADENEKSDGLEHLGETSYSALAEIAHLIKEPGFSGENEVRIVVTFLWRGRHIKYRSGAYGVVGYVELGSPKSGRAAMRVVAKDDAGPLPLRSVRTGPLLHDDHVPSIESFLRNSNHQTVTVTASQVPLR